MSENWWEQGWEAFKATNAKTISTSAMEIGTDCPYYYSVTTGGYWSRRSPMPFYQYGISLFITQLTFIFFLNLGFRFLLKPLHLPRVFSQILVGLLVGPTILKMMNFTPDETLVYQNAQVSLLRNYMNTVQVSSASVLANLSMFGFVIYQFLIGVKMDPNMIFTTGKKAMVIGFLSVLFPLFLSISYVSTLRTMMGYPYTIHRIFTFIGASQAMTSFPVIADLLNELKILNSELGRLALSSAFISDMLFRQLDAISTSQRNNISGLMISVMAVLSSIVFIFFVIYIFRPVCVWIIRRTPEGKQVRDLYVISIVLLVLASAFSSISMGQHVLFGPFILGLAVPDGPPLGLTLINKLETFFCNLLVPLFLTISGLRTDLTKLTLEHGLIFGSVVVVTLLVKFASVFLPALYCKMPFKDSLALALILSSKGIVEMAIYNSWKDVDLIDEEAFAILILSVVFVAIIVSPSVRVLYDPSRKYSGYIRRTIQHNKLSSELRVIVCIHEQENVPTIIKLLQVSNPTRNEPIYVYMIHLVELLGRSAPLLISHNLWKTKSLENSPSQQIINAFRHYERKYEGSLAVEPFTAISPVVTMHDDICMLALSKRASFIIIPFHKQWAIDGTMGSTNLSIRTVNSNVLNMAPCSVGLLVDRGHLGQSTAMLLNGLSYRVGLIFLGGDDDREALALAQRMAENPTVSLKVYRLVASNKAGLNETQLMLDDEAVREFKKCSISTSYGGESEGEGERIVYIEEVVRDGEEMASMIKSMENGHDLIIVGRRYEVYSPLTAGLTEWSECRELGVLGDMLASSDFRSAVSVLVVQQQIIGSMLT